MPPKSAPIRQACDACRLRKIRCEAADHQQANRSIIVPPCRACDLAKIPCEFLMPVGRRGPPAKRRRARPPSVDAENLESPLSIVASSDESIANSASGSATLPPFSEALFHASSIGQSVPAMSEFCSQEVLVAMIQAFLDSVYPLMPICHRPTLLSDVQSNRQAYDPIFRMVLISICTLVIAVTPRKLQQFCLLDPNFTFSSPRQLVGHAHALITRLKTDDYYDQYSFDKWSVAYLWATIFGYTGYQRRSNILLTEAHAIAMALQLQRASSYTFLSPPVAQVYTKAFWLMHTAHTQLRILQLRWGTLTDRFSYDDIDADQLIPLEVDDEFITATGVLEQPKEITSLTLGFNAIGRINACLIAATREPDVSLCETVPAPGIARESLGTCECGRSIRATPLKKYLQTRLKKLKYILDDLPIELAVWKDQTSEGVGDHVRHMQYETLRANIHVTHIWAQSLLLERLTSLPSFENDQEAATDEPMAPDRIWDIREDLCRQMLHILSNVTHEGLEANGATIAFKVRQVAVHLLECPFEKDDTIQRRAKTYLRRFADILASLDTGCNSDFAHSTWEELDRLAQV